MAIQRDPPELRLGIIGLGGAARQMLPSLVSHPNVRLAGAADFRTEARARFTEEFGAPAYEEAEAVCANPDIDAVYIATPHQYHREHALMAASAGKHIIVEKPMALTLSDCDAMISAVERAGVHMVVGHTHAFNPPVIKMREIIRSGKIGALAMLHTFSYSDFLYRPRRPEELDTARGGGIIYNQVPHQVDVVRTLGGGMVRSVRSMTWALDPDRPTEASHATFLQFEDGVVATLVYSGYDYFDSDEFHEWVGESGEKKKPQSEGSARAALRRLAATKSEIAAKAARGYGGTPQSQRENARERSHHPHCGITIASCAGGDLRATPDGVRLYGRDGKVEMEIPRGRAFPDKAGVIDELYAACFNDRKPLHDGRWAKATMEVSLAVLESARLRREIALSHQVPLRDGD